ncbi:MAG: helix-turn-helix transcriptional regulator [Limisphaerales bacterium]
MKRELEMSDDGLLKLFGERLAALRLAMNLTQRQLAEQAGLGLRTVQRLELGAAATQLSGFVRVCRVLGLLDRFDAFIPEAVSSPIAQLKLQGRRRQRATGRKKVAAEPKQWTWGETK